LGLGLAGCGSLGAQVFGNVGVKFTQNKTLAGKIAGLAGIGHDGILGIVIIPVFGFLVGHFYHVFPL
jgi:hypothetical protein